MNIPLTPPSPPLKNDDSDRLADMPIRPHLEQHENIDETAGFSALGTRREDALDAFLEKLDVVVIARR
jgi:hypothetical protein